jgi:hypothetical protein
MLRRSGTWKEAPTLIADAGLKLNIPEGMYDVDQCLIHVEVNPPESIRCKKCHLPGIIEDCVECGLCDRFYHKRCLGARSVP